MPGDPVAKTELQCRGAPVRSPVRDLDPTCHNLRSCVPPRTLLCSQINMSRDHGSRVTLPPVDPWGGMPPSCPNMRGPAPHGQSRGPEPPAAQVGNESRYPLHANPPQTSHKPLPIYLHAGDLSREACLGPGMASQLFPPHL